MKKIDAPKKVIFVCDGKKCGRYSDDIRNEFKSAIKENGLKKEVTVVRMDCTDNCKSAPVIIIQPKNIWLGEVDEKNVRGIFKEYFL
ncbi:(2Fe-2S) ferredoxin domain-containing protein [Flavobacterium zepuense]|uniref:(2Fe-2S) ferredoxin domain-containing protein n=1 Tax=Flavobacterium zepuense TaxID=2593302 RepID=A0A552UY35_9FLAO|nr:(2Fe-2S) ferredoxin domain-containing protein [Flavobacterium zepuense]TRW23129.1 (2Fe-2S) ferredoxin domain-containing protein [Flavobacterium zepuense]